MALLTTIAAAPLAGRNRPISNLRWPSGLKCGVIALAVLANACKPAPPPPSPKPLTLQELSKLAKIAAVKHLNILSTCKRRISLKALDKINPACCNFVRVGPTVNTLLCFSCPEQPQVIRAISVHFGSEFSGSVIDLHREDPAYRPAQCPPEPDLGARGERMN